MDEHDDDLESEVVAGAEKETAEFPNTGDALDVTPDAPEDDLTEIVDDDEAEL